jgi:hypothetical protein
MSALAVEFLCLNCAFSKQKQCKLTQSNTSRAIPPFKKYYQLQGRERLHRRGFHLQNLMYCQLCDLPVALDFVNRGREARPE